MRAEKHELNTIETPSIYNMFKNSIEWASKERQPTHVTLIRTLVAFVLVISFQHSVDAREYTVASSEAASDDNPGTLEEPLRTIGAAINAVLPGDVITVLEGDYRNEDNGFGVGVIPILKSGNSSQPILISAGAGQKVTVSKFLIQDASDLVIQGFEFRGLDFSSVDDWRPMPQIVRTPDPNLPRPDFTEPFETRASQIHDEFATYFSLVQQLDFSSGIDLHNCRRMTVQWNDVSGYFAGIQCRGCNQINIRSNKIRECTNGIFTFYSDDGSPGLTTSPISFNDVQQCLDNGIDIRAESRSVRVDDNHVAFNGRAHISLQDGAHRCRVRFNSLHNGGYYSETMVFPGSSGISLNDTGTDNVVSDNHVRTQLDLTGIDGNGIIIDILRENATASVMRNTSVNNSGAGLNLTLSPGTLVRGNVFALNGRFGAARYPRLGSDPRRGPGIKISRNEDINNIITNNELVRNNAAGIQSSGNIDLQAEVDRNRYMVFNEPLIRDGFVPGDREYFTLFDVIINTGREINGRVWPW